MDSNVVKNTSAIDVLKAKHKLTWEEGNYAYFAKFMEAGALEILNQWQLGENTSLLDIGCGAGQTAIPAARKGHKVTGIDIAENTIAIARQRANKEQLDVIFDIGDAELLPYENESFDNVISMFGAMFAPRPERVVQEFFRVLKPGGKLFMVNWRDNSLPARMFKRLSQLAPANQKIESPLLWGDEKTVIKRLHGYFNDIKLTHGVYSQWAFPGSPSDVVSIFKEFFGPVRKAFSQIEDDKAQQLQADIETMFIENCQQQNDVTTIIGGHYLQIIATKQ
ncbi:hypothetical protein tinsulaeT_32710 [Thalassotalea insulae]|uniref:Methyltransferase type 11 domain-containing protein n=1 Tax=Thalassotalea insulae TaxID=2056778 RepID=A0ABQ6GVF9_9GAMM|nr:class I SAM-dependent methyltransferase [Thalassotalea insulae]GLX79931.1 hypothetical protein tinsulaeT_32710 [Thalassotalea insulae]